MKKIIFLLFFIYTLIFFNCGQVSVYSNNDPQTTLKNNLLMEEAFLRSMGPEIAKAISQYYNNGKLYFLERITNIEKNRSEDTFDVTIQVVTFEKALLPPYGLETITLRIPGYKIVDFSHKEIKGEDLPEDKFDWQLNNKIMSRHIDWQTRPNSKLEFGKF